MNQGDIFDRLSGNPHAGIIAPDFKPIAASDDVVPWALDALALRREHSNSAAGDGTKQQLTHKKTQLEKLKSNAHL